eukprot:TRINITY_DN2709_c0_g1_i1.p4 TRINITY_DN2709_c0_g1~~TRINITY_DN2709_c0_g1_i1.p4  ORF type:complete len:103 (-),score=46.87 TRINITY_DN2709_c0_g1_i1:282-590(-)
MPEEDDKKRELSEEGESSQEEAAAAKQPAKKKKKKVESESDEGDLSGSDVAENVSDASGDMNLDTSVIITGPRRTRGAAMKAQEVIAKENPTFTDESEEDSE